jgi:predicted MFS family arabinose efflux permease
MRGHEAPTARARPVALAFAGFLSLAVAMGIGRFVYTPILPDMAEALGLSKSHAGLIASSNFAGYLTGASIAALPLRGRRAAWTLGALLASAVTTLAMGLVDTLSGFLAVRFAGGVASAFVLVFASAMVLEGVRAARRPGLAALHFAGVGIGIATSALVVAIVASSGGGWRAEWLATGAVALGASIAVAALLPRTSESAAAGGTATAERSALPIVLAYGLFGFGYVITATFLVAIMREEPGLAPYEPWVWMLVGLSAAPSVLVWDRIASRIGAARAFALACLAEAAGVAASAVFVSAAGAALAAILLGATFVAITALGLRVARDHGPSDPRRMVAVMTVAFSVGQIIGPLYAGALHDRLGSFAPASLTAAAALVLAAFLPLRLTRPAKRA